MEWNEILTLIISVSALVWSIRTSLGISDREKKRERPTVTFDDIHHSGVLMRQYGLYFINVGRTPAVNLTIPEEYNVKCKKLFSEWYEIRRELEANGGKTTCAVGPSRLMSQIDDLVVNYEDPAGNSYATTFRNGKLTFS